MIQRFLSVLAMGLLFTIPAFSQHEADDYWENEFKNEINREPMHATYFAYETKDLALQNEKEQSKYFQSLNGTWKFNWVINPSLKPDGFWKPGYDDHLWNNFKVPATWEVNGYGVPIYVNTRYEFDYLMKADPPHVPHIYNPVGSYRRVIEVDKPWKGKDIYLHFGAVKSNVQVWVNGQFVGYSEDSKLEAEFNVTKYMKPGKNLVAFQVYRWTDGSYMECQDMWRVSGVQRDVFLYARNPVHVRDIEITPGLDNNYKNGWLTINLSFLKQSIPQLKNYKVNFSLLDSSQKVVQQKSITLADSANYQNVKIALDNPQKWSAETPYLYSLVTTLQDKQGKTIEVIPQKVGFRTVEIKDGHLLVNGKKIYIKGVDRHEMDPITAQVISRERMEQDVRVMKENNINAIRTSHYPNDPYLYDLCDKYGMYVVDEANLETHGMGYGPNSLSKKPDWFLQHFQRISRTVERDKNYPSIIIWSMGNEAGMGVNFERCYRWLKARQTSRPVQYEQAGNSEFTDIFCPMYPSPNDMLKAANDPAFQHKPFIMCEYAHAMGNSVGNFSDYWDIIRNNSIFQGGFIWDFVDQSFLKITDRGDTIFAYGGDYGESMPSDENFNDNGLIAADRSLHPHMLEVKKIYQNIHTKALDPMVGKIEIYNENFFKDLSDVYMEWELVADGKEIGKGRVDDIKVAPQQKAILDLHYPLPRMAYKEVFLNVYYKTKKAGDMLPADWEVAKDQIAVISQWKNDLQLKANGDVKSVASDFQYILSGKDFKIAFSKHDGFIHQYSYQNKELIQEGYDLKFNFWRAPTDNDFGAGFQRMLLPWKRASDDISLKQFKVDDRNHANIIVSASYDLPYVSATLNMTYQINGSGELLISQSMKVSDSVKVPMLPKFGVQMMLPKEYDQMAWYGRGPSENYWDRKDAAFVGNYQMDVDDQFHAYVRPQETGNKSDIRWVTLTDKNGTGFKITSDTLFNVAARHFLDKDLDDGMQKNNRHSGELKERDFTTLSIDLQQMGLGGINSWGTWPLEKYRMKYSDYTFKFKITPVVR
jgi:beta-galactosidase